MKCDPKDLLLYAVTDRHWLNGRTLVDVVKESLDGGVTMIQLREKSLDEGKFLEEAKELQALCRERHVPFIVNDNVDIAKAMDADGVHVGQDDMAALDARAKLGPDKLIGVSAHTVEEALLAEKQGADYLGVGAVFPTSSKSDVGEMSYETLKAICKAVSIPVVAIGGISGENVGKLAGSGICGVAVISAIYAQKDIRAAAADQLEIWAERSGADIVRQHEGADPASVVYDGIQSAKTKGVDVIIIDTAGRLHNKTNLMNELNKISRIVERELPNASREVLLVLDGTTGQNGLIQAKQFKEIAGVTALAVTKLDGTAKGGIVIAVADTLGLPVKFIGVGEKAEDLMPFQAKDFVDALFE